MRRFWRGDGGQVGELAYRLTGSSDLYERDGRRPYASINFVTAHDGFTLRDLVSYNEKHNEANGEDNRDGARRQRQLELRRRGRDRRPRDRRRSARAQQRNFLATLLLSQGVPMLLAGDEMAARSAATTTPTARTTRSRWLDWNLDERQRALLEFTRRLISLRTRTPCFAPPKFFQGRQIRGAEIKDISWFRPDGQEMTDGDWRNEQARCLAVRLAGDAIDEVDEHGRRVTDDTLLILLNAHHRGVSFVTPAHRRGVSWEQLLDTRESFGRRRTRRTVRGGATYRVEARSLALFRLETGAPADADAEAPESARPEPRAAEGLVATAEPDATTDSVYCEHADAIVPLDEGFCRACSRQVYEADGTHHTLTPELMKQLGYATTEIPEAEAPSEEPPTDNGEEE